MSSFQEARPINLEYRQTGWGKGLNLFFVAVVFGFGAFTGYMGVTSLASVQILVLSFLIMAGGVWYLLTVLRSRIVIDGARIVVWSAFRERSADLSKIEGFQTIRGRGGATTGKLLRLEGGGSITVSYVVFDIDDRFREWISQYPDLDDRNRKSELAR